MEDKVGQIVEDLEQNPRPKKVKVVFPLSVGPGPPWSPANESVAHNWVCSGGQERRLGKTKGR